MHISAHCATSSSNRFTTCTGTFWKGTLRKRHFSNRKGGSLIQNTIVRTVTSLLWQGHFWSSTQKELTRRSQLKAATVEAGLAIIAQKYSPRVTWSKRTVWPSTRKNINVWTRTFWSLSVTSAETSSWSKSIWRNTKIMFTKKTENSFWLVSRMTIWFTNVPCVQSGSFPKRV